VRAGFVEVPVEPASERAILRPARASATLRDMEPRSDGEILDAILISCQYVHVKLDRILDFLEDDGQEEEDEADG
jgi:hypothetical protein